ncbi:hypothetical protein [Niabella aurantiaca]|uniref:hypothetical protein n=1 Tax=Niabella aurantiaca TaxID=379900 RepID=UPI000372BFC8|nr:hypothetical protein [Niabella aurantiaca]
MKKLTTQLRFAWMVILLIGPLHVLAQKAIDIGSRLELFVDDYLIDTLLGGAELRMHHPVPANIALVHDAPWEGSGSGFHSVFKDGDIYRMYYKAWQHEGSADTSGVHPSYCAYAESRDGIHWYKPDLGLVAFKGSKKNNIVITDEMSGHLKSNSGHPAVFRDENPNAAPDARYKALVRGVKPLSTIAYKSADGIHWKLMGDRPLLTEGTFDSQNLAFWDRLKGEYRIYWRYYSEEVPTARFRGKRAIRTAVSKDFLHWSRQQDLSYGDAPEEDLYTSQVIPYYRAPQIYIGFPALYKDRGWSESMRQLPELRERKIRAAKSKKGGNKDSDTRFGTVLTEGLLMAGRDGVHFKRWPEAFLRPGIERKGSWTYGDNFIGWQMVETKSPLPGAPNELSFYVSENYWKGRASAVRRYTLRIDGFVSVNAPMKGGTVITRPFVFSGDQLVLNFSSSAAGDIRVEIQDVKGKPVNGFSLADCVPVYGDAIARKVFWNGSGDLSVLQGKPVRLRFVLKDADLYSFGFQQRKKTK